MDGHTSPPPPVFLLPVPGCSLEDSRKGMAFEAIRCKRGPQTPSNRADRYGRTSAGFEPPRSSRESVFIGERVRLAFEPVTVIDHRGITVGGQKVADIEILRLCDEENVVGLYQPILERIRVDMDVA